MASITLQVGGVYTAGATVGAYNASDWNPTIDPTGSPPGSAVNSQTVAADGTVPFTGLTAGARYFAYSASNGRYLRFTVPAAATSGVLADQSIKAAMLTDLARADPFMPTGAFAETYPRRLAGGNVALTSGTLYLGHCASSLPAGRAVSTITVYASSAQGAVTPTHQWVALFDKSRNKLAVSTDKTTTAWAGGAAQAFTISYTPTDDIAVYLGILVTAGTAPQVLRPGVGSSDLWGVAPALGGASTTGLTDPASCPSTAAAPSGNYQFYAYFS